MKGRYLFNLKLKHSYTDFLIQQVFKNGSKLEYLEHHLRSFDKVKYRIPFVSVFKALGQNEKHYFDIVMILKCKKVFECTYHPATNFLKHGDPYDFYFESLDWDFFL